MTRVIHLASQDQALDIKRFGIKGLPFCKDVEGSPQKIDKAVLAAAIFPDFSETFRWLREMQRVKGKSRMVAVHFHLKDDERILVGCCNKSLQWLPVGSASRWFMDHPHGPDIIIPRSIQARDIVSLYAFSG